MKTVSGGRDFGRVACSTQSVANGRNAIPSGQTIYRLFAHHFIGQNAILILNFSSD